MALAATSILPLLAKRGGSLGGGTPAPESIMIKPPSPKRSPSPREKGTMAAGKSFSAQMGGPMNTVFIIVALLIVGSAIWGWRGYRR